MYSSSQSLLLPLILIDLTEREAAKKSKYVSTENWGPRGKESMDCWYLV
jgi:hypothetical protein